MQIHFLPMLSKTICAGLTEMLLCCCTWISVLLQSSHFFLLHYQVSPRFNMSFKTPGAAFNGFPRLSLLSCVLFFPLLIISMVFPRVSVSHPLQSSLLHCGCLSLAPHLGSQLFSGPAFSGWGHLSSQRSKPEFVKRKTFLLIIRSALSLFGLYFYCFFLPFCTKRG